MTKGHGDQPNFRYLVQNLGAVEQYWLYNNFDKAYAKMKSLGRNDRGSYILEPVCIAGEWRMKRTFKCFDGIVSYDGRDGDILLHVNFYTEAGEQMNIIE